MRIVSLVAGAAFCLAAVPAEACTTFCLLDGGRVVVGRNYDFEIGDGLILVNKRGVERRSGIAGQPAAQWVSRYGSLTFNQFGRDSPTGGVNEAGLVVDVLWLDGTRYPDADARPALGVLEWIQYLLDTKASVAEVLTGAEAVRVSGRVPVHYFIADAGGAAATLEFLDGRLVVHAGPELPIPVLTNNRYDQSAAYAADKAGGLPPAGAASLARFTRATAGIAAPTDGTDPTDRAFAVLADVAQGPWTRWSIVYDLSRRRIHLRTSANPARRSIDLAGLDWSCRTPMKMLDIDAGSSGDVTAGFADYTAAANEDLLRRSYRGTSFIGDVPDAVIAADARWPEASRCTEATTLH